MYEYECMYSISKRFVRSRWLVLFHQMYPLPTQWISYKQNMTFLFYSTIHVRIIWPHFVIIDEVANYTSYYQNVYIEIAKLFMKESERRSLFPITHRERRSHVKHAVHGALESCTGHLTLHGHCIQVDHCPEARCSVLRPASAEQRPGRRCARPSQARLPRCQLRGSVLDKHVQCPHLECLSLG